MAVPLWQIMTGDPSVGFSTGAVGRKLSKKTLGNRGNALTEALMDPMVLGSVLGGGLGMATKFGPKMLNKLMGRMLGSEVVPANKIVGGMLHGLDSLPAREADDLARLATRDAASYTAQRENDAALRLFEAEEPELRQSLADQIRRWGPEKQGSGSVFDATRTPAEQAAYEASRTPGGIAQREIDSKVSELRNRLIQPVGPMGVSPDPSMTDFGIGTQMTSRAPADMSRSIPINTAVRPDNALTSGQNKFLRMLQGQNEEVAIHPGAFNMQERLAAGGQPAAYSTATGVLDASNPTAIERLNALRELAASKADAELAGDLRRTGGGFFGYDPSGQPPGYTGSTLREVPIAEPGGYRNVMLGNQPAERVPIFRDVADAQSTETMVRNKKEYARSGMSEDKLPQWLAALKDEKMTPEQLRVELSKPRSRAGDAIPSLDATELEQLTNLVVDYAERQKRINPGGFTINNPPQYRSLKEMTTGATPLSYVKNEVKTTIPKQVVSKAGNKYNKMTKVIDQPLDVKKEILEGRRSLEPGQHRQLTNEEYQQYIDNASKMGGVKELTPEAESKLQAALDNPLADSGKNITVHRIPVDPVIAPKETSTRRVPYKTKDGKIAWKTESKWDRPQGFSRTRIESPEPFASVEDIASAEGSAKKRAMKQTQKGWKDAEKQVRIEQKPKTSPMKIIRTAVKENKLPQTAMKQMELLRRATRELGDVTAVFSPKMNDWTYNYWETVQYLQRYKGMSPEARMAVAQSIAGKNQGALGQLIESEDFNKFMDALEEHMPAQRKSRPLPKDQLIVAPTWLKRFEFLKSEDQAFRTKTLNAIKNPKVKRRVQEMLDESMPGTPIEERVFRQAKPDAMEARKIPGSYESAKLAGGATTKGSRAAFLANNRDLLVEALEDLAQRKTRNQMLSEAYRSNLVGKHLKQLITEDPELLQLVGGDATRVQAIKQGDLLTMLDPQALRAPHRGLREDSNLLNALLGGVAGGTSGAGVKAGKNIYSLQSREPGQELQTP